MGIVDDDRFATLRAAAAKQATRQDLVHITSRLGTWCGEPTDTRAVTDPHDPAVTCPVCLQCRQSLIEYSDLRNAGPRVVLVAELATARALTERATTLLGQAIDTAIDDPRAAAELRTEAHQTLHNARLWLLAAGKSLDLLETKP